ncbi:MAG TPA: sucrase ferredoxin [Nocardioidaceae bacterium]
MNAAFRCSRASDVLAEPVAGTASTVRAFLLVEAPGPWGVDAIRASRLPDEVKRRLAGLPREGVRPLVIRRHGGASQPTTRVYAAYVHTARPWAQTVLLDDPREVLDLDLAGLGEGRSPGLEPHTEPLFLVCTHGKHDVCCAERGRPVCKAISAVAPEHTWEVSHIGGDRFAANVLVLPDGLYYGRLSPESAAGFVAAHRAGEVDLEHLRGRCAHPFPVQAAEVYLRRHLGLLARGALTLKEHSREGAETRAVFAVDGACWEVRVHTAPGQRRQLTCRAASPSAALEHTLVGIER